MLEQYQPNNMKKIFIILIILLSKVSYSQSLYVRNKEIMDSLRAMISDTVPNGTVMTKWNAAQAIATLQTSIDAKISASSTNTLTNKSGSNNMWTNDAGYLTSTSLSGYVQTTRTISTSSPLSGGGDLSANRTFSIANSAADGSTKGAAAFESNYFDDNGSGIISWALASGTGTVSASAVTINTPRGKITYNSPSIVAAGTATFTLTNSLVTSTSVISVGINGNGSNLTSVNCYIKSQTSGSCVVAIQNLSLLSLFNTNMIVDFLVVN